MKILIETIKILISAVVISLVPTYVAPIEGYGFIVLCFIGAVLFIMSFPLLIPLFLVLGAIIFFPEARAWMGAGSLYVTYRTWLLIAFIYVTASIALKIIRSVGFTALALRSMMRKNSFTDRR